MRITDLFPVTSSSKLWLGQLSKHFLVSLIFFLSICSSSSAQPQIPFSGESEKYLPELKSYFSQLANNQDRAKAEQMLEKFQFLWESRLEKEDQDQLAHLTRQIFDLKIKSHKYLYSLLESVVFLEDGSRGFSNRKYWTHYAFKLVDEKRADDFEELLQSTEAWLQQQKVGGKGTVSWYLRNADWHFDLENNQLFLHAKGTLIGASRKDSSVIQNTSGKLAFASDQWQGEGGELYWQRFGGGDANGFVRFSNYKIDFSLFSFAADSVVLKYPTYFSFAVIGSFQDQIFNSPPGERTNYPRFYSYRSDLQIKEIFPNVEYNGAINFEGKQFLGKTANGELAKVTFKRDQREILSVRSDVLVISAERIQSEKAAASIYLAQDSVFHPGLWFRYDHKLKKVSLLRSEKGIPDGPFFNTFHEVSMFASACEWNTEQDEMTFQQARGLQSQSVSHAESSAFFDRKAYDKLQGIDNENPLAALFRYKNEFNIDREVKLGFLSAYLKKPPEQVAAQLLKLAALGYLIYDAKQEIAWLTRRFDAVMGARSGKSDFDVISFHSTTSSSVSNMLLNISNNDLQINGIKEVVLSENQGVQLFPDKEQIVLKRNRDFVFSGLVRAGLFDFYAKTASFEYDSFKLNFSFVDSLAFDVPTREQSNTQSPKEFVRVRNVIADLTGTLLIDEPFNKSGMKQLPRFPVFTSKSESYVYFDRSDIQNGELSRNEFFYVIDPFEIDSLDNFSTDNLRFNGYLTSAGIFPVFREPLTVMKDYSLGFEHTIPENGYPVFAGLAHYFTALRLSNQGFQGLGSLDYQTATAYSKDFLFSPFRVIAKTEKFEIRERLQKTEFPVGKGTYLDLNWSLDSNQMILNTDTSDFRIYADAKFSGTMIIQPDGMTGDGQLAFDQAVVSSHWFNLRSRSFHADTADFRLLADSSEREAFLANDYQTSVDFEARNATFNYIHQNSRLSFPFNQYVCTLDEAFWDMNRQTISLNNNKIDKIYDFSELDFKSLIGLNLRGSEFMSVHPAQDSLSFFCLRADYDLKDYLILAKDVKIIRVGDAAIFPSDTVVAIGKDAELKPVESAVIIADTIKMQHVFTDVKVNILSRNQFKASGSYTYINTKGESASVLFDRIASDDDGRTIASGTIKPEDNFFIHPSFAFAGKVHVMPGEELLRFEGGYKLVHQCLGDGLPFVVFDAFVDPKNVRLPVKKENTDINGMPVRNGFYYASLTDSYFGAFLQQQRAASDEVLSAFEGFVTADPSGESYRIEPLSGQNSRIFLTLDTKRCVVMGKAPIDLDLRLTQIEFQTAGAYTYKIIPDSLYLDLFASLNFHFEDKLLEIMHDSLNKFGIPGGKGMDEYYLLAAREKLGDSDFEKLSNEIALYGSPRKVPDIMTKKLVFSHLKLKWNQPTRSFISQGPIVVSNIGKNQLNKAFSGFVELEKSRSGDAFSVYLMAGSKQWYYFNFKSGVLQTLSSSDVYNTELMSIKAEKRLLNDPEKGGRYEFTISTRRKMVDFLRKMQSIE